MGLAQEVREWADQNRDVLVFVGSLIGLGAITAMIGLLGCGCSSSPPVVQAPSVAATCYREFAVDGANPHRWTLAGQASNDWRELTGGRVDLRIHYGQDSAGSRSELAFISSHSPEGIEIEERYGTETEHPAGVTRELPDGRVRIVIIVERAQGDEWRVLAHEMGHSCGIDDLEDPDAVMSRARMRGGPEVLWFQPPDIVTCRWKGFCS